MGVAASDAAKSLAHSVSFGVTLAVLTNVAQMIFHKCRQQPRGSHWSTYRAFYLALLSVPLVMADLTRHVLQDADMWTASSHMYRPGCEHHDIRCLSVVGWFFSVIFTYSGFACLVAGSFISADLVPKLKDAWNTARGGSANYEAV